MYSKVRVTLSTGAGVQWQEYSVMSADGYNIAKGIPPTFSISQDSGLTESMTDGYCADASPCTWGASQTLVATLDFSASYEVRFIDLSFDTGFTPDSVTFEGYNGSWVNLGTVTTSDTQDNISMMVMVVY